MSRRVGWHRQDILAAVKKRGISLSQLSVDNGLARTTLNNALVRRYPRANAIIADFIGVSRHHLWPHWFGPNDELLPLSHYPVRKQQKAAA